MNACKAVCHTGGETDQLRAVGDEVVEQAVEWYEISGRRVAEPLRGLYMRLTRYSDGSIRSAKVIK